jgi:hypothetical protein
MQCIYSSTANQHLQHHHHHLYNDTSTPYWLVNLPSYFIDNLENHGKLLDVKNDVDNITLFTNTSDYWYEKSDAYTDGELSDSIDHFFWGMRDGIAMELGALDGSPKTRSMTHEYERVFGWKRILIEGNHFYRGNLKARSPLSFSAHTPICESVQIIHYAPAGYLSGIVEHMTPDFLKLYHKKIYNAGEPKGSINITWHDLGDTVRNIKCMPLKSILSHIDIHHINFFVLDVEGAELEVLKSINWSLVKFDILCIETDPLNRKLGFGTEITSYLYDKGYKNVTSQMGRNIWFTNNNFIPSSRPNINIDCFKGAAKTKNLLSKTLKYSC